MEIDARYNQEELIRRSNGSPHAGKSPGLPIGAINFLRPNFSREGSFALFHLSRPPYYVKFAAYLNFY